ncbi:MAG: hypothetical protein NUV82_04730 [Candidatus Komeilibacteria bacterium]|nr:hypothetical protein [Candidatus Komeilibacteria bacterium]
MHWKKALGFGLLLWVMMFVTTSIFIILAWVNTTADIILAIFAGIFAYILTSYIRPLSTGTALSYGLIFVIIYIILDLIITASFEPNLFRHWTQYLTYIFILFAPIIKTERILPPA